MPTGYTKRLYETCAVIGLLVAFIPSAQAQDTAGAPPADTTAGAQTSAPDATAATPAQDSAGIGDIVVTAQRRSESVLRVPVSVTVVGAEALANNGINDLRSLAKLTPSLQAAQDNQFSIRGIGTATFADTVESSVTQVVDDVVLGSRYFGSSAFYDVERVEVLNGPQGLLFGKNASAGVVNITTARPKIGEASGSFDVEGTSRYRPGQDGLGVRVRSTANVPVSDTMALRLNATYGNQDGITRIVQTGPGRADNGIEDYALRGKFLFNATPDLSIYVIGDYSKMTGVAGSFDYTYRELGAGSQYPAILAGAGVTPGNRNLRSVVDGAFYRDLKTGGLQGKVSYALANGWEISDIAAWKTYKLDQSFDSDFTPVDFLNQNLTRGKYNQYSNEFRVTLPSQNRLSGQFGAYYFYAKNEFSGARTGNNGVPSFVVSGFPFCVGATPTAGAPPACNVSNQSFLGQDYVGTNKIESIAGFGQFSYAIVDGFKLTAGGRVTHDRVSLDLAENAGNYFVTLGVPDNQFSGVSKNTNFSWKVGADWQATPQTLLYGFYGHGYKGPGFSNASPAPGADLSVSPEISKGGEIGLKQSLLDRRLNISVSGFYTKFDNLQVQAFSAALRTVVLQNAAKATTKGIDINIQARPFRDLTLNAAATILDAKYDSYPGRQCYPGQRDSSCLVNGTFDVSGRQTPLAAKFTSTVSADYDRPIADDLNLVTGVSFYHRSSLLYDYAPGTQVSAWNTIDGYLGLSSNGIKASLFCKNCFNAVRPVVIETESGDGINVNALSYVQRWSTDSVRTIGVRLGLDF